MGHDVTQCPKNKLANGGGRPGPSDDQESGQILKGIRKQFRRRRTMVKGKEVNIRMLITIGSRAKGWLMEHEISLDL